MPPPPAQRPLWGTVPRAATIAPPPQLAWLEAPTSAGNGQREAVVEAHVAVEAPAEEIGPSTVSKTQPTVSTDAGGSRFDNGNIWLGVLGLCDDGMQQTDGKFSTVITGFQPVEADNTCFEPETWEEVKPLSPFPGQVTTWHNSPETLTGAKLEQVVNACTAMFTRMGSKSELLDWLYPRFPRTFAYCEPFCPS